VWPGHYTGLVADINGRFHALWADRRNPIQQLYAASIDIIQTKPSSPELTDYLDITKLIRLVAGSADFNENDGITTFDLQIQNVSDEPIFGPLRVEVSRIESGWNDVPTTEIMNADNKKEGAGAAWKFIAEMGMNLRLDPKGITEVKKIILKTFIKAGLDGKAEFRVFGKLEKAIETIRIN